MKSLVATVLGALVVSLVLHGVSLAKRVAPPEVAPVTIGEVEYRAPSGHMGYVDAHAVKGGRLLWSRQIYVVVVDPEMEKDVQDVFINTIKADGNNALILTNERGGEFRLDLSTLEVKTVK